DATFRAGFARLAPLHLSFDAWLLEPQLPDLIDLARAFPQTRIVLDHVGTPLGIGAYAGRLQERFPIWRDNIKALAAASPNVFVKLGGRAWSSPASPPSRAPPPSPSHNSPDEWRPSFMPPATEALTDAPPPCRLPPATSPRPRAIS